MTRIHLSSEPCSSCPRRTDGATPTPRRDDHSDLPQRSSCLPEPRPSWFSELRVFGKLSILILAVGVTACALLVLRQQRLDAVHELAVAQARIAERDRDLYEIRTRIATRVMPNQVELLAARIAPLEPIRFALPQRPGTPEPQAIAKVDTTRRTSPPSPGRVPPRAQR